MNYETCVQGAKMGENNELDIYWEFAHESYHAYPTVRHRKDFLLRNLAALNINSGSTLLDFGCGGGGLLSVIKNTFLIPESQLTGYDISMYALYLAMEQMPKSNFTNEKSVLERSGEYDFIVCSEVIEHTADYMGILKDLFCLLKKGGYLCLTTQAGPIHASDRYVGHTQHFQLDQLVKYLSEIGFSIVLRRKWGFPFFTVQKYLTDTNFGYIKKKYLEGTLDRKRGFIFNIAYYVYCIHEYINFGPQLFVIVKKYDGRI